MNKSRSLRFLVLALLFGYASMLLAQNEYEQAEQLIGSHRYAEAYAALKKVEDSQTAGPRFDYLLGTAALNSGHYVDAIYAFERVLGVEPDNTDARIGIADAYLATNENEAAAIELESLASHTLSSEQSRIVNQRLAVVNARRAAANQKVRGSIGIGGGFDSNVSSGPEETAIMVPNVGPITLTSDGKADQDGFGTVKGDIQLTRLLRSNLAVYAGGRAESRSYFSFNDFNYLALNVYGGVLLTQDGNQYKLNILEQKYWIDGADYQNITGLQGQWKRQINGTNNLLGFLQAASTGYPGQRMRDVYQYLAGVGMDHFFGDSYNTTISGSVYLAMDSEQESGWDSIGRNYYGAQIGVETKPDSNNTLTAMLNYQDSRYGSTDPIFLVKREDTLTYLALRWSRKLGENWSIEPGVCALRNASTLAIDDYSRTQAYIMFNRRFQ